ncbi:MAG: HAMP domain-containing methyl-accepting chemotaxis protein [Magnetospirillum sp.]|jgi:methyl-accepting chemotaxis protein|nr:HAMP domain-containing methyl-accepting chemotaxis protein [Magnetospirillum sp.]
MDWFNNLRIRAKISLLASFLALVSLGIAGFAVDTMRKYNDYNDATVAASRRALSAERVNGLINATVMESRGVYMSQTTAEATRFGQGIAAVLKSLETEMEKWRQSVEPEQRAIFEKALAETKKFIDVRTELARLGREVSPAAARVFGDNDANRANRQALNKFIEEVASADQILIAKLDQELSDFYQTRFAQLLVGSLALIAIGLAFALFAASRAIAGPINRLGTTIEKLAAGDTNVSAEGIERKDEVGMIARTISVFRQSLIDQRAAQEKERADVAQREARTNKLMVMIEQFRADVSGRLNIVGTSVEGLNRSAEVMNSTAGDTLQKAVAVAAAAEEASANVQTVASATEELTASIREISGQVSSSSGIARKAVEESEQTNAKVKGLAEAAQRIGAVVQLINNIASQTNLLALNATIEAARAGDAGKGFAVVASEVKNLASQTAKATDEIGQQISEIQEETTSAVAAIGSIGGTIREIDQITTAIAAAIEEQTSATQEISRNVLQASDGTREVSVNITGVNDAADKSGRIADEVRSAAGELTQEAVALRQRIDTFLTEVAAA